MDIVLMSISELLANLDYYIETFLTNFGMMGAVISCLLITIESIVPVLPLCVFITLLFLTFGNVIGFLISWLCTCLGCYLSFSLFRSRIKKWFEKKLLKGKYKKKIKYLMEYVDNISLSGLTLLVAIPFTPAFAVNIAAGLSNMSKKKFLTAIIIGKIFMVYFWGYIGTTLIECFTHPEYLVKIIIMLAIAFGVSKVISRYLKFD